VYHELAIITGDKSRKGEMAGHLQRRQEQDTCRKLTLHTTDSNGLLVADLVEKD
jgi:hypothetical protein